MTPPHALLAVDERCRQHRAAGDGGAQSVARVEGCFRAPLMNAHADRPQQRPLDLGETVHRQHGGGDSGSTQPQLAERRLAQALAS